MASRTDLLDPPTVADDAATPEAATPEPEARANAGPAKPIQLVVRRGALRRFESLKARSAELPVVVMWDRRQADRRRADGPAGEDRRRGDRRQAAPFTWDVADFLVAGSRASDDDDSAA